jgi:hypothetical protein
LSTRINSKKECALADMLSMVMKLDWNGTILGDETPCGSPQVHPNGNRLTLYNYVISWSKRNNMMYALIGQEMGLSELVLIGGGHAANIITSSIALRPSLDSPEAVEAYRAGFDLFNGLSLDDVMKNRALKMHQSDGWDQWEWPSHETSQDSLDRFAEHELQELIK